MAAVTVLIYRIDTTYDTPSPSNWNTNLGPVNITADNHLHVIIDDVTFALTVEYRSSSTPGGGSYLGTLTEGPNLFFGFNGAATLLTASPYWQACDGTALRKIGTSSLFPYATLSYQAGAAECAVAPVCDLAFSPFYTYDHATGPTNNDGYIQVFASSSNGTIKYALNDPDFDYATEGQTSNEFFSLAPNLYTVYAKDAAGCQDTVVIEIGVTETYGIKYRLEFEDSLVESGKHHRIDILERAYSGAITAICAGGEPVHIKWNGYPNDPDLALVPSEMVLAIKKEVAGTFTDLFTDDDRLFKVEHRVSDTNDFTGIPIYWTGYVIPEFHNEHWIFEPYDLEITATDQLGELKNLDFVDENDNLFKGDQKAIKIIAAVLKKSNLNLNIRCGLNIFSVEMTSAATDDPLDQAYVDTRIFLSSKDEPIKCDEVIKRILEPFRATLCQSMGYWWIRRISDMVGTFAYREFDVDGDYSSNTTFAPTKDLQFPTITNRAAWANKTARLSHLRNYGYFKVTHNAGRDNNLIDEGRFEAEDIEEVSSGNQFFKNWNFFLGQAGAKFGHETVDRTNSTGAFFLDLNTANNAQTWNKLYSKEIDFSSGQGAVKLQFDYLVSPNFAGLPYITLGWSVKVTNGTSSTWMRQNFPPNFSRANNTDEIINEIYVTSFDSWTTVELTSYLLAVAAPATLQVTFYMHNHYGRDFADITALKTFSISGLDASLREGKKVMVGEDTKLYVYTSVPDAVSAESLPDVVRPNDYANDYLWTLDKIVNLAPNIGLVNKFLIDNVIVSYYPYVVLSGRTTYITPPETVTYSEEVSAFIKSNLLKDVYLGDMPRFNDEYEDNERLIYRGYFRMADGSPTTLWARLGVTEEKKLLTILKDDLRDQYQQPLRKLSGTFISDIVFHFVNSIQEHFEGSRYQILTMDFDLKRAQYTVDIAKVRTAGDGEPPLEVGAFSTAYSDDFDSL